MSLLSSVTLNPLESISISLLPVDESSTPLKLGDNFVTASLNGLILLSYKIQFCAVDVCLIKTQAGLNPV